MATKAHPIIAGSIAADPIKADPRRDAARALSTSTPLAGRNDPDRSNSTIARSTIARSTIDRPTIDRSTIVPAAPLAPRGQRGLMDVLKTDRFKEAVSQALPSHLKPERFIRVAITALTRTPKLQHCTEESFVKCLMDLSMYGLEPDGRRAHLIPFENKKAKITECTLIIDWKGIAECIMRSGLVSYLHADVVYAGDIFEYSLGEIKDHVPHYLRRDIERPKEKGERYAAYSIAKMKDGTTKCEVMSADQILSIRDHSQGWISFQKGYTYSSPWQPQNESNEGEMWKKTVFRRLSKWLPLSAELRDIVDYNDDDVTLTTSANDRSGSDRSSNDRSVRMLSDLVLGNRMDGNRQDVKGLDPSQEIPASTGSFEPGSIEPESSEQGSVEQGSVPMEANDASEAVAGDRNAEDVAARSVSEIQLDDVIDRLVANGIAIVEAEAAMGIMKADWNESTLDDLHDACTRIENGSATKEEIFG